MFMLRGFRIDSLQETHPWHVQRIDHATVDVTQAVHKRGADSTKYGGRYLFLYHAPIFGGWKNYSVYEVGKVHTPFHIGWIVRHADTQQLVEAAVQRLPIYDSVIRMLDGSPSYDTYFFAIDRTGHQIQLRRIGQGTLGDGKYLSIRLF
jgi:hypothetical protein